MHLLFLTFWATLAPISQSISLWDPTGPYHVGYTQHVFNHTTPKDPTKPGNIMLLTIYYPTRQIPNITVPYLDPISASIFEKGGFPNGSLSTLTTKLQFQAATLLDTNPEFGNGTSPYPTIIFLPGTGLPARAYTAYQSELASYGYTVISIDHPGEAPFIQLPYGGEGIYTTLDLLTQTPPPEIARAVYDYRVSDVLAMINDPFLPSLIHTYGAPINTTHFGIFGHSIGGAAAAGVMAASDTKTASLFKVGGNLDGRFTQLLNQSLTGVNTSIPVSNLKRPFLELATETTLNGRKDGDITWEYFNAGQSEWWRALQIVGTEHLDFSDIPLWVERLGGRDEALGGSLGGADGVRTTHIVASIMRKVIGYMEGKGLKRVDEYTDKVPEAFRLGGNDGGRKIG
ncbi:hypothetical protein E1B28_010307 [Marasmius oreades]|uniref:1-alkyl-2-acetylglycerophosphocholine esterase n=1 Tax=Marasmius oreades TaxID=181124 RepID=A0A9P7RYB5_9AGAR|nr:uncharacterized protein E1B28_010307 [Marasmius oreades]KAG7091258.1 hypothetical protein E1B28_010307 [Marasmius oreades]